MITYGDGTQELEVLHTGPPHCTDRTIDRRKFIRQTNPPPGWTLSIEQQSDLEDAVQLIHATLVAAAILLQAMVGTHYRLHRPAGQPAATSASSVAVMVSRGVRRPAASSGGSLCCSRRAAR